MAKYALHQELHSAITAISKGDPMYNDMIILSYLGNTVDDTVAFLTSLSKTNDPSVGSIEVVTNESPSEEKSPIAFVVAIGVPLLLAIILSMYVVRRSLQKKNGMNQFQSWEEYDPAANIVRGTGDPPDSFHDGLYHYMNHGQQRYLSTQCTLCLETRRNIGSRMYAEALKCSSGTSSLGNILPKMYRNKKVGSNGEVNDDDHDEAYQLARAKSDMKLGQYHMGMDVHVCQSATCTRCMANQAPMFVPTGIIRYKNNQGLQSRQFNSTTNEYEGDSSSSLSSSATPASRFSGEDNQSYETKSTMHRNICTPVPVPTLPPNTKYRRSRYSK
jgi:hypothetical protein